MNFDYDTVIVGGGAAGLSAALVLSRARRRVLVVDSGEPRNAPATQMHGFLSRDGLAPAELLATGRDEVRAYGGNMTADSVVELSACSSAGFRVALASGTGLTARTLLLTTGLLDELPEVPGLRERWARDVLHCPYCHGWEVRDQALGVLWGGPEPVRYTQIIRQWSPDVVLFAPVGVLTELESTELAARSIVVVAGVVARVVVENDRLVGVAMDDGRTVARTALFVPPRFVPNTGLLVALDARLDERGFVVTDANGAASVPGLWAAGNASNPRAQVITAAGEGSAAAIAINAALVDDDVQAASTFLTPQANSLTKEST
jgi:thioredoxin reductase